METKQTGSIMIYGMLGSIMLMLFIILTNRNEELPVFALGIVIPLLALVLLLFYRLSVNVTIEKVVINFGIGLIRRSFEITDIESCTPVINKWWYGWGIHFTGNTTIYNVSGMKAIELTFKGRRRKVRIGTDQPEVLSLYINDMLHRRQM